MVSEGKIAANRRNATKSCGPKTETGKEAARMNALKHGMTAEIAILPEEDAEVFERGGGTGLRHTSRGMAWKRRRSSVVFTCGGSSGGLRCAQSAQLCEKAQTAEGERLASEARETIELSIELYLPGPEARWGNLENSKRVGDRYKATGSRDRGFEHAALIESRLEELEDGCRWLYVQWKEEAAILDAGKAWGAIECFKALRLMGMQPLSVVDLVEVADFLRPCVALAGRGIELAREIWALLAPPDAEQGWEVLRASGAG